MATGTGNKPTPARHLKDRAHVSSHAGDNHFEFYEAGVTMEASPPERSRPADLGDMYSLATVTTATSLRTAIPDHPEEFVRAFLSPL